MTDNIYTYLVPLPPPFRAAVTPCSDGYTVYLAERLSQDERREAYEHELKHIKNNDFYKEDINEIEAAAHVD